MRPSRLSRVSQDYSHRTISSVRIARHPDQSGTSAIRLYLVDRGLCSEADHWPKSIAQLPPDHLESGGGAKWLSGPGPFLFQSEEDPNAHQKTFKTAWRATLRRAGVPYFRIYDLIYLRHTVERRRSCLRIRDAAPEARGCEGLQEVLSDEAANEAGGSGQVEPERQ